MTDSNSPRPDRYSERLTVPWWWWLCATVLVALLGYEAQLAAYRQPWSVVFYPIFAALAIWLLLSMGRTQVRVDADGGLHADKAILPVEAIGRAATVPPSARSAAMGRQLDPAAFLVYRSWVKPMVLLVLDDPDDPTPYWLVSTRHPEQVLEALGLPDASLGAQAEPGSPESDSAGSDSAGSDSA